MQYITNDRISEIEKETKNLFVSFKDDYGKELSETSRPLIFGRYSNKPQNFKFQPGERDLLLDIVKFVNDIIKTDGHTFFKSNGAHVKDFYNCITQTEIGIMFCTDVANLVNNLEKIGNIQKKMKAKKLKNGNHNALVTNEDQDQEMIENAENGNHEMNNIVSKQTNETDEIMVLTTHGFEIKILYNLLFATLKKACARASRNVDFEIIPEIKFFEFSNGKLLHINDTPEFFDNITEFDTYNVQRLEGTITCKCKNVFSCFYYSKNKQISWPIRKSFTEISKQTLTGAQAVGDSMNMPGYFHLINFEKHILSHKNNAQSASDDKNKAEQELIPNQFANHLKRINDNQGITMNFIDKDTDIENEKCTTANINEEEQHILSVSQNDQFSGAIAPCNSSNTPKMNGSTIDDSLGNLYKTSDNTAQIENSRDKSTASQALSTRSNEKSPLETIKPSIETKRNGMFYYLLINSSYYMNYMF